MPSHTCTHTHRQKYVCTHTHADTHACTCIQVVYTRVQAHTLMFTKVHVCVHIYMHTHELVHTHTQVIQAKDKHVPWRLAVLLTRSAAIGTRAPLSSSHLTPSSFRTASGTRAPPAQRTRTVDGWRQCRRVLPSTSCPGNL